MKRYWNITLLVIYLNAFNVVAVEKGEQLPLLTLTAWNNDHVVVDLQKLKGKVLYIDFWASWCIPCKKSFPMMNELRNKYSSAELEIVAINMDEYRKDAEKFLTKHPALFTVVTGNAEAANTFNIPGLPTAYLVNQQGYIMSRHIGFNKKTSEKTIKQIDFLLAEK
ncbi:MAG: thiol-disulfide isomerase/thioredoxin [Paraglaciecola sp.]|jgi:thiol-disulfide isomerase/thioredoxin